MDDAILDIQLRGERVFPVAEALRARAVTCVFASGFDQEIVPEAYREVPVCAKPLDMDVAAAALFGERSGAS